MGSKLVSNNQGLEVAKLARDTGLSREVFQGALRDGSVKKFLKDLYNRGFEAESGIIVRTVIVDRTRGGQEVLDATGRVQYTVDSIVKTMPRGEGEEVDIYFIPFSSIPKRFQFKDSITDDNLERALDAMGFRPADPYSLAKYNEDNPNFADTHLNETHWKDEDGNWCSMSFSCWLGVWRVHVRRGDGVWLAGWYFGVLLK